jgi:hypothetical protein
MYPKRVVCTSKCDSKNKNNTSDCVESGQLLLLSNNQEQYLLNLWRDLDTIGGRLTKKNLSKTTGNHIRKVKGSGEYMNKAI